MRRIEPITTPSHRRAETVVGLSIPLPIGAALCC